MDFDNLMDGIEKAIGNALIIDEEGDYNFDVPDAAQQVIDYLQGVFIMATEQDHAEGIEDAINGAMRVKDDGTHKFYMGELSEAVIDYLEGEGLINFKNLN